MTNSKKQLIRNTFRMLLLLSVLFLTGCSTTDRQKSEADKLTVVVTSDIHYLATKLNDNGEAFQKYISNSDGKYLSYIDEITDAFSGEMISKKPEVLIISGDLTNNGEKESHQELADQLKAIEQSAGTKIYVIPGNHDINNPWARGFQGSDQYVTDAVNPEDFENIYADFGYAEAISRDKASLSYLAAPTKNLWFLMLDTSIYEFNELMGNPMMNGEIGAETLTWIEACSEQAKKENARLVAVMHHNLMDHSSVLNKGFTLNNKDEVMEVFKNSNIDLVFSGHIHMQNIKKSGETEPIYDIASGSLAVYPVQYGVLTYTIDQGFDYSTSVVDMEGWAKRKGIDDENLLHFTDYSKEHYIAASMRKANESLAEAESYTEDQKRQMAETMGLLNLNYFAGTIDLIRDEVMASEGYRLWEAADSTIFAKNYILSVLEDGKASHNRLTIK